jgi:hypothetical protein
MPEVLHIILNRDPFAQIAAGTKRTEYRACTPYWRRRLEGRHYDAIYFRNGYETKLERQLYRAMNQLERLQRMRQGEAVRPPLIMEVSERS